MIVAMLLFGAAILILLWPVDSRVSYSGKSTPVGGNPDRSVSCDVGTASGGLNSAATVFQAFRTPGPNHPNRARILDCAAKARDLLGFAVLLMVLAIPPALLAILRVIRWEAHPEHRGAGVTPKEPVT
jgi:hypothetical protein